MSLQVRDTGWRLAFILGLVAAPRLYAVLGGAAPISVTPSTGLLVAGGLLIGFGTRLGGGCTSGHGVAGVARLSLRSLVATGVFLPAGMVTVRAVLRQHNRLLAPRRAETEVARRD